MKNITDFQTIQVSKSVPVHNFDDIAEFIAHFKLDLSEVVTLLAELTYWRGADLIREIGDWDHVISPTDGIRNLYANNIHFALMPALGIFDAVIIFSGMFIILDWCLSKYHVFNTML